jgi:hypothetical protein
MVDAGRASGQLGHQPGGSDALGQRLAMTAVLGQHHVVEAQGGADAGGDGLLADTRMDAAHDIARPDQLYGPLLEPAD